MTIYKRRKTDFNIVAKIFNDFHICLKNRCLTKIFN